MCHDTPSGVAVAIADGLFDDEVLDRARTLGWGRVERRGRVAASP